MVPAGPGSGGTTQHSWGHGIRRGPPFPKTRGASQVRTATFTGNASVDGALPDDGSPFITSGAVLDVHVRAAIRNKEASLPDRFRDQCAAPSRAFRVRAQSPVDVASGRRSATARSKAWMTIPSFR